MQGKSARIRLNVCHYLWLLSFLLTSCGARLAVAVDELDYGLEEHQLAGIELRGNSTYTVQELKSILQIREPSWMRPLSVPRYRPDLIDTQLRLLQRFYQQGGFHQVAVSLDSIRVDPEDRGDIIYISIVEGPRTMFARVAIIGVEPFAEKDLRKQLQLLEGMPAPADLNHLGRELYALRSFYWERAYLEVKIDPQMTTELTEDPDLFLADLEYHITPGKPYTINRIFIKGNEKTHLDLILRELRVEEGGAYSWKAIDESHRLLLETSLFRDVSFTSANVDSAAGKADLNILVVERRPAFYELGAGVGSYERVRVLGAWGHNNLFGTGRRLTLRGKVYWNAEAIVGSDVDQRQPEINYRADILYVNPHIRGSRFQLDTQLYLAKVTRGSSGLIITTLGFVIGTQFRSGPGVFNTVGLNFEENDPRPHPDSKSAQELFEQNDIDKSQIRSVVHTLFIDKRDNIFNPFGGSQYSTQLEIGGGPLGGDHSFLRLDGAWHGYKNTFLGGVLAFRLRVGAAKAYGDSRERGIDGVPYERRFFAGGASSVRGFLERSLGPQASTAESDSLQATGALLSEDPARGGNYLLLSNIEWRFPLPLLSRWNFNGVLFFDGGNVWTSIKDLRWEAFRLRSYPLPPSDPDATRVWDYRYSVGVGVRLNTPAGPFRFDVGWPLKRAAFLNPEGEVVGAETSVLYYFSLGYPF